jgi:hypothetical protein
MILLFFLVSPLVLSALAVIVLTYEIEKDRRK